MTASSLTVLFENASSATVAACLGPIRDEPACLRRKVSVAITVDANVKSIAFGVSLLPGVR